MENNKFNKFYSTKSVNELLEKLRSHRITGSTLDKEWFEGLKQHLIERDITDEERKILEHILSAELEILMTEVAQGSNLIVTEEIDKYPALRTIARFFRVFAWIVGILAIIIAIYFGSQNVAGILFALLTIVVGTLIVSVALVLAESIKVITDIEYNTRQMAKNNKDIRPQPSGKV